MQMDKQRDKIEAYSCADIAILMLGRIETLEDALLVLIFYADARVRHSKNKISPHNLYVQRDLSLIGRELEGIGEQIHQYLVNAALVGADHIAIHI